MTNEIIQLYLFSGNRIIRCFVDRTKYYYLPTDTMGGEGMFFYITHDEALRICDKRNLWYWFHSQLRLENDHEDRESHPDHNSIRQTDEERGQEGHHPHTLRRRAKRRGRRGVQDTAHHWQAHYCSSLFLRRLSLDIQIWS